jgi:hypothetical protein
VRRHGLPSSIMPRSSGSKCSPLSPSPCKWPHPASRLVVWGLHDARNVCADVWWWPWASTLT